MSNFTASIHPRSNRLPTVDDDGLAGDSREGAALAANDRPHRMITLAVWGTIGIALVVLLGWVFQVERLKVVIPGLVSMKINTALAFLLIGISLGLTTARHPTTWTLTIAKCAAIGAILINGVALAERIFSWDAGIDEFFAQDLGNPDPYPGRPSPATSLNFCLLGCALLLHRTNRWWLNWCEQLAIIFPFLLSALALVGYLYGASSLHGIYPFSSMALHTAFTFVLFTLGMLYSKHDFGVMAPLRSEGAGGILARRMIPTIFIVSLIAGWLRLQGIRRELFPMEFALALHCVVAITVFTVAVWWVSRLLDRADVQRKQAEMALEKNRIELAHVLRINTMGEMVAGIAHELNQPLSAIGNFARGTVRRLQSGQSDNAELLEVVQIIASESTRAAEIILSLRRYVQNCSPQRLPLDINTIVHSANRILSGEANQRNVRVALQCDPTLPEISIDRVQIKQVIVNLICNGFDAVETVAGAKWIQIETKRAVDGGIEVRVTDNGCGLPPENRHRIFEAFFTTKPEGLGMGLAISRSIIVAHDGSLWAEKRTEGGTTFCFTLPVQASEPA